MFVYFIFKKIYLLYVPAIYFIATNMFPLKVAHAEFRKHLGFSPYLTGLQCVSLWLYHVISFHAACPLELVTCSV